MNKKIKEVSVSRSYSRKIKFGENYEMMDLFSSYTAILEKPTEEEIKETSEWLYTKAQEEVDWQVDCYQKPDKVLRGYAGITELRHAIKGQDKLIKEQAEKINQLEARLPKEKEILPF